VGEVCGLLLRQTGETARCAQYAARNFNNRHVEILCAAPIRVNVRVFYQARAAAKSTAHLVTRAHAPSPPLAAAMPSAALGVAALDRNMVHQIIRGNFLFLFNAKIQRPPIP
jgi:putative heme iron utilization protein